MLNPNVKILKSKGIDLPVMKVYLAGRIAGDCIDKCLSWRKALVNHYRNYKKEGAYPIAFFDALNSKESDSVDAKGLTSAIPPNLIYDKDILSVLHADVIIANMEDYFEEDIQKELNNKLERQTDGTTQFNGYFDYVEGFFKLQEKILNRRENLGTVMELAIALYLQKPTILIVPERRQEIFRKHPFTKRASVIVCSVEELIKDKWLNILYKSMSGATYE